MTRWRWRLCLGRTEVLRRGVEGGSLPGSDGSGWIGVDSLWYSLWCSVWPNPRAGLVYVRHPVHAAQHMHDIPCQIRIWWLNDSTGCSSARQGCLVGLPGISEMLILNIPAG